MRSEGTFQHISEPAERVMDRTCERVIARVDAEKRLRRIVKLACSARGAMDAGKVKIWDANCEEILKLIGRGEWLEEFMKQEGEDHTEGEMAVIEMRKNLARFKFRNAKGPEPTRKTFIALVKAANECFAQFSQDGEK